MNLKHYLLIRIFLIAVTGLLTTAAVVLYQANQQSRHQALLTMDSMAKQLELQLLLNDAGFGQAYRFPDFDLWKATNNTTGLCIRYLDNTHKPQRSLCKGSNLTESTNPNWFTTLYSWIFQPSFECTRPIMFKGKLRGTVAVTPSAELEIANAWQSFKGLMGLSLSTTLALCILISVTLSRALAPAQMIVSRLQKMSDGDLSLRLPAFDVLEWQQTGIAINQLAASQAQLLSERKKLAQQLMTLQEEERRFLAHELHDEFGQCLAAINAIAASITQSAEQICPALVAESLQISHISNHILTLLRGLLLRLRPAELDELGLTASLRSLIRDWNTRSKGKTQYQLILQGAIDRLPEPLPITLFRVVQESMSNIAKHANASEVLINLTVPTTTGAALTLTVTDNGTAQHLPFANTQGIGLLGIGERLSALGGQLSLTIASPQGLILQATLPLHQISAVRA